MAHFSKCVTLFTSVAHYFQVQHIIFSKCGAYFNAETIFFFNCDPFFPRVVHFFQVLHIFPSVLHFSKGAHASKYNPFFLILGTILPSVAHISKYNPIYSNCDKFFRAAQSFEVLPTLSSVLHFPSLAHFSRCFPLSQLVINAETSFHSKKKKKKGWGGGGGGC